jgi:hypothetical protein
MITKVEGMPGWIGEGPGLAALFPFRKGESMWGVYGGAAFAAFLALMFARSDRRHRSAANRGRISGKRPS